MTFGGVVRSDSDVGNALARWVNQLSRESIALAVIICAGVLYIVSNARFGIIDPHSWRQADVYANVLGFTGSQGVPPLTTFDGRRVMFDVPIYQLLIAGVARLTMVDPLIVTRFVNAGIWPVFVITVTRIGDRLHKGAGIIAAALITLSPLMVHFWSIPLPDVLALTLSVVGFHLAISHRYRSSAIAFGGAALIKSPVPFIVLVVLTIYVLLSKLDQKKWRGLGWIYLGSAGGALLAEVTRRVMTPPSAETETAFSARWYFGYLGRRANLGEYQTILTRLTETFPGKVPCIALLVLSLVGLIMRGRTIWRFIAASSVAFVTGWVVFPLLYQRHEYYALPGATFVILSAAAALSVLVPKLNWLNFGLAIMVPICLIYAPKMSEREISNFYDSVRYALEDQPYFVLVEGNVSGPGWGGHAGRSFIRYQTEDFKARCEELFVSNRAFITLNIGPTCLDDHLSQVQTKILGPDGTVVWVFSAS